MTSDSTQASRQHPTQPDAGSLWISGEIARANDLTAQTQGQIAVQQQQNQHQALVLIQRFIGGEAFHLRQGVGGQIVLLQPSEKFTLLQLGQGLVPGFCLGCRQGIAVWGAVALTSQPNDGSLISRLRLFHSQGDLLVAVEPAEDLAVAPAVIGITGQQPHQQAAPWIRYRVRNRHAIGDHTELPGLLMDALPEVGPHEPFQNQQSQAPPIGVGRLNADQPFRC